MLRVCCYISPTTVTSGYGEGCKSAAEWGIYWAEPGKAPYDCSTDACTEHVGAMLNVDGVTAFHVYSIGQEES